MSTPTIYKGRGTPEMYDDLLDFLNYVFGFDGNGSDFKKLLPKLYNPEYNPCFNNYVITENGKLKAAVGAYDSVLKVGNEELKCRGIGNVAVHPYSRSKGYMIETMNMAIDDMIKDGVDFSLLGGIRQRYNYYGFESAGPVYKVVISSQDTGYRFDRAGVPFTELELKTVNHDDTELIDKMHALYLTRTLHTVRQREAFLDICRSWSSSVTAILKNGEFIGYFVGALKELTLIDSNDFNDVIRNYIKAYGSVELRFGAWETEFIRKAAAIGSAPEICYTDMLNVFNYKNVISAFLKFKASSTTLADGEISVKINGSAGVESLLIYVENGVPYVEEHDGECDIVLEHLEAINFFFGLFCERWDEIPAANRSWLPLPFFVDNADIV